MVVRRNLVALAVEVESAILDSVGVSSHDRAWDVTLAVLPS